MAGQAVAVAGFRRAHSLASGRYSYIDDLVNSQANCVEVAWLPQPVTAVRDAKNTAGPALTFPTAAGQTFAGNYR